MKMGDTRRSVPTGHLVKAGEPCPGSYSHRHREHGFWFAEFEALRAFPGAHDFDALEPRTAEACIVLESEARAIEQAEMNERSNNYATAPKPGGNRGRR